MFISIFFIFSSVIAKELFAPIYFSKEIIIEYGIRPFDICKENPILWDYIKKAYIIFFVSANLIVSNFFYYKIYSKKEFLKSKSKEIDFKESSLNLLIGEDENKNKVYVPELGLYQNFLITGTIGSGKTSSAMYPFTRQLIEYNNKQKDNKIGMLILDVKGNYYNQVKYYVKKYDLEEDLIVLELNSKVKYNPLHKPNLKPQVLAHQLKTILTLFSENNSESFWLDKAEQIISESIKLCRLYNNGYVTFMELHKLITIPDYYKEKIQELRKLFMSSKFSIQEVYDLNSALEFFQNEFSKLDSRTMAILKSEITRITSTFVSDYDVLNTFGASRNSLTLTGFEEVIKKEKY